MPESSESIHIHSNIVAVSASNLSQSLKQTHQCQAYHQGVFLCTILFLLLWQADAVEGKLSRPWQGQSCGCLTLLSLLETQYLSPIHTCLQVLWVRWDDITLGVAGCWQKQKQCGLETEGRHRHCDLLFVCISCADLQQACLCRGGLRWKSMPAKVPVSNGNRISPAVPGFIGVDSSEYRGPPLGARSVLDFWPASTVQAPACWACWAAVWL